MNRIFNYLMLSILLITSCQFYPSIKKIPIKNDGTLLPFGVQWGMNNADVVSILEPWVSTGLLQKHWQECYNINVPVNNSGKTVTAEIHFQYDEAKLYRIEIKNKYGQELSENESKRAILWLLNKTNINIGKYHLNHNISIEDHYHYQETTPVSNYTNLSIISNKILNYFIVFSENRPSTPSKYDKIDADKVLRQIQDEQYGQDVRMWVKKYLKNNLKDPKSYESIEWSYIKKTTDGYSVRHKYRAKNSFGGYVIENKIFILDNNGNIISVKDYD